MMTGAWRRKARKPTWFEWLVFGDRDDIRRNFTNDEMFKIARRGWFNFGSPKCRYCGARENLHVDHVFPISKGGSNDLRNLQLLCQKCNLKKHAK